MKSISLIQFLIEERRAGHMNAELSLLIEVVARACKRIAVATNKGALGGVLGRGAAREQRAGRGAEEARRDLQRDPARSQRLGRPPGRLRVGGNGRSAADSRHVPEGQSPAAVRSAGRQLEHRREHLGRHDLLGAALPDDVTEPKAEHFLQPGTTQLAAGYVVYGPATVLVLTFGHGTHEFTLDREVGSFVLSRRDIRIPEETAEFAINMSNQRHWEAPMQRYIGELLAGKDGPRGKDFNMRWVASMVADVHRIMTRGGVFYLSAGRQDRKSQGGKLRLMYEANPMAFIVEQAGGAATTGRERIMDLQPTGLHQRVPVFLGSKKEVEVATHYHLEADAAV